MARQLRWSPEAVEDVEAIAIYIERDSSYYAQAVVVSRIVSLADSIPEHPELGRRSHGSCRKFEIQRIVNGLFINTESFIELNRSVF